ncbi:MAG: FKBP-type peptidyl-prolyl cis-trans isomerase [Bacteroidales bacterium]|nr:FKBP-type peptidyl-prolyl cis-trans isomerase [Bacteroidales bacterium]MCF8327911.1 FKBP-type peptidyl-prolyl cis-trans isomerase [Bacteroidales bacterium]
MIRNRQPTIKRIFFLAAIFLLMTAINGCNNQPEVVDITENKAKDSSAEKDLVKINKEIVRVEEQFIENYIERHNLDITKLKNGIRYEIYSPNPDGAKVESGDRVTIKYKSKLLTGQEIDKRDSLKQKQFVVAESEEIQGLHYSVLEMREGEKGIFIIPSHLAYGITGEQNKVPHSAALVYDITLKTIMKNDKKQIK